MRPQLTHRDEYGVSAPVLVWRFDPPVQAIASGPLGGGIGARHWLVNASVPMSYDRPDPDVHLAAIASGLGLRGPGVGLLTGVDVADFVTAEDGGVSVAATVGLGAPVWAAAPDDDLVHSRPGTINIVAALPVALTPAALVNAVATVAEAKAQALWELALPATGTVTDATCVLCPMHGDAEPYAGPRSRWGARLARAVHAAVLAGGRSWLTSGNSWSDRLTRSGRVADTAAEVTRAGDSVAVADVAAGGTARVAPTDVPESAIVPKGRPSGETVLNRGLGLE